MFETGRVTVDVVVFTVALTVVVVEEEVVVLLVAVFVVANVAVMVGLMVALVLTFDVVVSGFDIAVSLLFLRPHLLRSSLSVICSTISSPRRISLIGLFSYSMPRNRRAMS